MRLQEIYSRCKKMCGEWQNLQFTAAENDAQELLNSEAIVKSFTILEGIHYFEENVQQVIQTIELGRNSAMDGKFDPIMRYRLKEQYDQLHDGVETLAGFFESVGYRNERIGIDIKLPPNITLEDLGKCIRDLNQVFTICPLLKTEESCFEFKEVDVGSIWLGFAVAGGAISILGAFAVLVDKLVRIRSHYLTTKQQEESLRNMSLKNDVIEQHIKVNEKITEEMIEKACEDLSRDYDIADPEEQLRLKYSLGQLYDWMKKGMEIYASIPSPEKVQAVFPTVERQALPEEVLKLLAETTKKKEE